MKQLDLFLKEKPEKPKTEIKPDPNPLLGAISKTMGYTAYIQSDDWACKRRMALYKRNNKCQRCGSEHRLEVHHKHYETLYHERLHDVEVLCKDCHNIADVSRAEYSAFASWVEKKYGDFADYCDDESIQNEFDRWLERKQGENDY